MARLIRKRCGDKYPYKQALPGSSSFEIADSFLNEQIKDKNNRNLIKFNDDNSVNVFNEYDQGLKLALYLGVSNTISTPIALKFDNNNPNYLVYANNKKLAKISSNTIASLLYETSDQDNNNISYVSVNLDSDELKEEVALKEIKSYYESFNFVQKRLTIIDDPALAVKKIITLHELWYNRKMAGIKRNKKSEIDLKTPYYLVINNIDWMFDNDIVSSLEIEFEESEEKSQNENNKVANITEDFEISTNDLNDLLGDFFGNNVDGANILQNTDITNVITTTKTFSSMDLISKLITLLKEGVKYNVFCIVCLNSESSYNELNTMVSGLKDFKSIVYGSYNYIKNPVINEFGEVANTCALSKGNEVNVIRLYDYSINNAKEFWNLLNDKYNNKGLEDEFDRIINDLFNLSK